MAALRTYTQRRAPRVLSSGALRACSAAVLLHLTQLHPAGISSEFTASYLRLRSVALVLDRQAVLSRPPELPRLSEPFYKFARRHVPSGSVKAMSLAARWLRGCFVLLSNPGALW